MMQCPTTWGLSKSLCHRITHLKSSSVVFTLTDYRKSIKFDSSFVSLLLANYDALYFWPQGTEDISYLTHILSSLNIPLSVSRKIQKLEHTLPAFDNILQMPGGNGLGTNCPSFSTYMVLCSQSMKVLADSNGLKP